jgi:hypothetical protein
VVDIIDSGSSVMDHEWSTQQQRISWRQYLSAAVIAYAIPLTAFGIQSGWVAARGIRLYQASLEVSDLATPTFWLGNAVFGLLNFLILCLVIKNPIRRRAVVIALCAGYTGLLFWVNSAVYK